MPVGIYLERMTTLGGQGSYYSCLTIKGIVFLRVKRILKGLCYMVSVLIVEPG